MSPELKQLEHRIFQRGLLIFQLCNVAPLLDFDDMRSFWFLLECNSYPPICTCALRRDLLYVSYYHLYHLHAYPWCAGNSHVSFWAQIHYQYQDHGYSSVNTGSMLLPWWNWERCFYKMMGHSWYYCCVMQNGTWPRLPQPIEWLIWQQSLM